MENERNLEEIAAEVKKWFEALDRLNDEPFLLDRKQIITPERHIFD